MNKKICLILSIVSLLSIESTFIGCKSYSQGEKVQAKETQYMEYCGIQTVFGDEDKTVEVYEDTKHNKVTYTASDGFQHSISVSVSDLKNKNNQIEVDTKKALEYCGTQVVFGDKTVEVYEDKQHNKVVYVASDGFQHSIAVCVADLKDKNNQIEIDEKKALEYCGTQTVFGDEDKTVEVYEDKQHKTIINVASDGFQHSIAIAVSNL